MLGGITSHDTRDEYEIEFDNQVFEDYDKERILERYTEVLDI